MKESYYKDLKVSSAPDSEMTIEGEIPFAIVKVEYDKIYAGAKRNLEVPGFRAGKAPEHLVKANLSELSLLDMAAEEVFKKEYPEMAAHFKIIPIDRPKIEITKLAPNNPLGFRITVTVMPKIDLPDYRKIARENKYEAKEDLDVTEKELSEAVEQMRKTWAHEEYHKQNAGKAHDHGESFDHLMPDINEEFVKKIGFKDVDEFKDRLKKNIVEEKKAKNKDKKRIAIVEALVKDFSMEMPKIFLESELDKMLVDLNNRISSSGITPADYYKQIGKTEADIRTEWRPDAIKRVKMEILLGEIAKKEAIKADKEAVDAETKHLLSHYKDADPDNARMYVEHMLINDKVFDFLEKL